MNPPQNLKEYYAHYLTLHSNRNCRRMHVMGQFSTLAYITLTLAHGHPLMLLVAPFIVYPFAWAGHFLFEKNKPAAFTDPVKAKICDWIMFKDILIGRIPL